MKILVDADACPRSVLQICRSVGQKYAIPVWTVASFNHHITSDHHVVVGNDSQEVDIKVINLTKGGDVVVTQDWGLAAMVLSRGARCLTPTGREYRPTALISCWRSGRLKRKFAAQAAEPEGPKREPEPMTSVLKPAF